MTTLGSKMSNRKKFSSQFKSIAITVWSIEGDYRLFYFDQQFMSHNFLLLYIVNEDAIADLQNRGRPWGSDGPWLNSRNIYFAEVKRKPKIKQTKLTSVKSLNPLKNRKLSKLAC